MSQFAFDHFGYYEIPNITLCNPDSSQLYNLGEIYDRQLKIRYNALSEFSFTAPAKVDSVDVESFPFLDYRRLINIENIALFMITGISEDNNGIVQEKKITCQSIEVELNFKKLSVFSGQYKFYDLINASGTLLQTLIAYLPGWTIADVDTELTTLYRSFDITDATIYNFLMNDVSQAYQCIFVFDRINRTISAHTVANATTQTDIFLNYDNLVEKTNIKTITEELITALGVYGGGDLSINVVNPLGNNNIYDFSYYMTTDWMSQDLIDAITAWNLKVTNNQIPYANLLTLLKESYGRLITLQSDLVTLQGELVSLENLQKVKIQQGLPIGAINTQIKAKKAEITAKQAQIVAEQAVADGINVQLRAINTDLSFAINFTTLQQTELSNFIIGSTYTNTNFIQTDIMTPEQIQEMAQELYDQAIGVLAKVSEPRYTFELDSVNFTFLQEFQEFIDQLDLACVVTVEIRDGVFAYPALLQIDINYDNPEEFKLTFSNRLRLDNNEFQFSDLFNATVNSGITANFNSEIWSNFQNNYKDDVSTFITSALDASKNAVVNASNQEFLIDSVGMRGRYLDPATGQYAPEQLWMINNMLVFTKDNWDTASLAIGEVQTLTSGSAYGLISEKIINRVIKNNGRHKI